MFYLEIWATLLAPGYIGRGIGVGPWCTWVGLCFFFVFVLLEQDRRADFLCTEFALLALENKSKNPKERWMDIELILPFTSLWCSSGSLTFIFRSLIYYLLSDKYYKQYQKHFADNNKAKATWEQLNQLKTESLLNIAPCTAVNHFKRVCVSTMYF